MINEAEHVKLVFPTPIYTNYISLPKQYENALITFIREQIHEIKNEFPNPFTTKTSYFLNNDMRHSIFNELIEQIDLHVYAFARYLNISHHLFCKSMWSSISSYGQQHAVHHHGSCAISGVYYLSIPTDKNLNLFFQSRHSFQFPYCIADNEINASILKDTHEEKCETSKIILFTGDTLHGFEPNPSHEDKIAVAFNYDIN